MYVGNWGSFVFQVSGVGALSFSELTEKSTSRWAEHETINTAPLSEFLGPGLDELDMTIIFTTMLNVEPRVMYELLRAAVRNGEHYPLILQGVPLSMNQWYIREITGTSSAFRPVTGEAVWMECTCSFKEYN